MCAVRIACQINRTFWGRIAPDRRPARPGRLAALASPERPDGQAAGLIIAHLHAIIGLATLSPRPAPHENPPQRAALKAHMVKPEIKAAVRGGETVLVTDRDRVVAEIGPPRPTRSPLLLDAIWLDPCRQG